MQFPINFHDFRRFLDKRSILTLTNPENFLELAREINFEAERKACIKRNEDYRTERPTCDIREPSLDWHIKQLSDKKPIELPYLHIYKGSITGHEGRHRAKAADILKIPKMPLLLTFEDKYYNYIEPKHGWVDYDTLNDMQKASQDILLGMISKYQKEKMIVPSKCKRTGNELKCYLKPESPFNYKTTQKPSKHYTFQIGDFGKHPFC